MLIKVYFSMLLAFIPFFNKASYLDPINYIDRVEDIRNAHIKYITRKHKLGAYGTGGRLLGSVNGVSVYMNSNEFFSIERARFLLVSAVEDLKDRINRDKYLRPYLKEYPFQSKHVEYSISMQPLQSETNVFYYKILLNNNDTIFYIKRYENGRAEDILVESYSEAYEKVKDQVTISGEVLRSRPSKYLNPHPGKGSAIKARRRALKFYRNFASQNNLKYMTVNPVVKDGDYSWWSALLGSFDRFSLEEGKNLVTRLCYAIDQLIETDPVIFQNQIDVIKERIGLKGDPPHLSSFHFGARITFWDQEMDRYPKPYLAEIKIYKDMIYYYVADDKTQELVEVFKESFDEARKRICW